MPTYLYRSSDGTIHAVVCPIGAAPKRISRDGEWCKRDISAEHSGHIDTNANYPMKCEASGVHPHQIAEARNILNVQGTSADFTRDGRPIYTSALHRKKCLKAFGLHDRNGGYGDP